MKVTVCQLDPRPGILEEMLDRLKAHIRTEQSDFLLLPEMCFADWLAAEREPDGEKWRRAVERHATQIESLNELGAKAAIGSRPVLRENGSRRNEAYLWTPATGARGVHEKYYLPNEEGYWENEWYERGEKRFDLCRALDMRIGIQICTEMWFFEWARHFAAGKADLLCVPRATPHGTTHKWLAGGQAAAVCSGAYCLSSNLFVPEGEKANCGGLSWIIDPEGQVLATTSEEQPFKSVEIDLTLARESKYSYPRYVPE
ncbi:MAG: carbon-nitrogen hydrolase family protein [Kiloniellales bacterium]|nr:carbon-nitrogen hydrolase family protein [Kiloniellales bacterium]